jgi:predicted nucleotidyltransferase
LKYIPSRFQKLFNVDFLERTWKYGSLQLFRAENLYTAGNYNSFLETFRRSFPQYVYFCPFRGKEVISAPLSSIREVFVPKECLRLIANFEKKDHLQKMTLDFVNLLSDESGIAFEEFGVHGSVALNMHSDESDIDIVVYGSRNFRALEQTISRLVNTRVLCYLFSNRLDAARRFKGQYKNRVFMYNAIRKPEEINVKYGMFRYSPVAPVKFTCAVKDDSEAMFRPAIYEIEAYRPADPSSDLPVNKVPDFAVSMIGCYRNVARKGKDIRVCAMLEHVENPETGRTFYQAVVGTGTSEDERIWPL